MTPNGEHLLIRTGTEDAYCDQCRQPERVVILRLRDRPCRFRICRGCLHGLATAEAEIAAAPVEEGA